MKPLSAPTQTKKASPGDNAYISNIGALEGLRGLLCLSVVFHHAGHRSARSKETCTAKSGWLCAKLSTLQPSTPIFGSGLKARYYDLFPGPGFVGPAGTAIATLGQRRNQSDLHHHAWRLPLGTSTTSMYQRAAELRLRRPLFVQGLQPASGITLPPENLARSIAYG